MEYLSVILFTVVLLAQIVLFVLFFLEKRYVNHRFSAMLQYIDRKVGDADCREEIKETVDDMLSAFGEKLDERFNRQSEAIREFQQNVTEKVNTLSVDYSEAQQAADKVNDFASSLASIFDYDPLEAIKRGRAKEAR